MTKDFIQDPFFPECPIRNILVRIGGKWTLAVLYTLGGSDSPMRFRDIEQKNPDCSQKARGVRPHRPWPFVPPRHAATHGLGI